MNGLVPPNIGIYPFTLHPITFPQTTTKQVYPEPFLKFPKPLLLTMLTSSLIKLLIPFSMEYLYTSVSLSQFTVQFVVFIVLVGSSYFLQRQSQRMINQNKLVVRKILCGRVAKSCLSNFNASTGISLWTKVSSNINIYVNNHYDSYVSLVFQVFKSLAIVIYLVYKLGMVSFLGFLLCGLTVQLTLAITRQMQIVTFGNVALRDAKVNILTQYFQRIVDYQMSWLDSFIAKKIDELEVKYHCNLRRAKLLDSVCVGLWQFTTMGISSVILCAYYYCYGIEERVFEPATIVYLFQMFTFPLNVISWNLAGIENAQKAISELNDVERGIQTDKTSFNLHENMNSFKSHSTKPQNLHNKVDEEIAYLIPQMQPEKETINHNSLTLEWGRSGSTQISRNLIYGVSTNDANWFKQITCRLTEQGNQRIGYVDENSWFCANIIETLLITPRLSMESFNLPMLQQAATILSELQCHDIPLQNPVSSYSGGQKLRISLCRALLWSRVIIIDSDLKSIDSITRDKVLNYLNQLVHGPSSQHSPYTVLIRDPHKQLSIANQWLNISHNKLTVNINKYKPHKPLTSKQSTASNIHIQQRLLSLSNKIIQTRSQPPQKMTQSNTTQVTDQLISFKTLTYYFTSSQHLMFIVCFVMMKVVESYFNYFINVVTPIETGNYMVTVLQIACAHLLSIIGRSYFFATANLTEAERICHQVNSLAIYNHVSFYEQERTDDETNNPNRSLTEQLVCLINSDENTISQQFPFHLNIFCNNLGTVLTAFIIIAFQVPYALIMGLFLWRFVHQIDRVYRQKSERLKQLDKEQEISLMTVTNQIEQACFYLKVFRREEMFQKEFQQQLGKTITIANMTLCLGLWVKANYRVVMMQFMIAAIVLYAFIKMDLGGDIELQAKQAGNHAGLAVMIRQIMTLADYILFFSMSLAETRAYAVSIERVRRYVQEQKVMRQSQQRKNYCQDRLLRLKQSLQSNTTESDPLIAFTNFSFKYTHSKSNILINVSTAIHSGDMVMLRGRSGAGKTTLLKLMTGLYPQVYFPSDTYHLIAFSSQHPLNLKRVSLAENVDPYNIMNHVHSSVQQVVKESLGPLLDKESRKVELGYEEEMIVNSIRAYLYGHKGLVIYDEALIIPQEGRSTYLAVTHHRSFAATRYLYLRQGELTEIAYEKKQPTEESTLVQQKMRE